MDFANTIKKASEQLGVKEDSQLRKTNSIFDNSALLYFAFIVDQDLNVHLRQKLKEERINFLENIFKSSNYQIEIKWIETDHKNLLSLLRWAQFRVIDSEKEKIQYDAKNILNSLQMMNLRVSFVQAIIDIDAFDSQKNNSRYILGINSSNNSIVFTKRLNPDFWQELYKEDKMTNGISNVSTHEFGHCFGLEDSYNQKSVMFHTDDIRELWRNIINFNQTESKQISAIFDRFKKIC